MSCYIGVKDGNGEMNAEESVIYLCSTGLSRSLEWLIGGNSFVSDEKT
ncbi:hypothetical protein HMPREF1508_0251 [Shuttleworthella sp. MSX8B]|nr:hypothetical protein HMPREF1508_0251 [Shuttleworthia sp. MSX8B]